MKKLSLILLFALIIAISVSLTSCNSSGLKIALNDASGECFITGLSDPTLTEIVVPAEYRGRPVTGVIQEAFMNNTSITKVTFEGPVFIGYSAFEGCTSLTSVQFVESGNYIGENSFAGCSSLKEINLDNVYDIDRKGFANTSLERIEGECIYVDTWLIGLVNHHFGKPVKLEELVIPEGVEYISSEIPNSSYNITLPTTIKRVPQESDSCVYNYPGTVEQWKSVYTYSLFASKTFWVNCTDGNIRYAIMASPVYDMNEDN